MSGGLDEISVAIGQMRAEIAGLGRRQDEAARSAQFDRHEARKERHAVRNELQKVAGLADEQRKLKETVEAQGKRIDQIEPVVSDIKAKMAIAAAIIAGGGYLAWQAVSLFAGELKALLHRAFS